MGMYDESWCCSCGCSIPYTADESATCGSCASEEATANNIKLIEYIKLHLISLEQDSDELNSIMVTYEDLDSDEYRDMEIQDISLTGQMIACQHLLSVASDILCIPNERK